jgi:hypothetical protein
MERATTGRAANGAPTKPRGLVCSAFVACAEPGASAQPASSKLPVTRPGAQQRHARTKPLVSEAGGSKPITLARSGSRGPQVAAAP